MARAALVVAVWTLLSTHTRAASVTKLASTDAFDAFREQNAGFALLVYAPWCGHSRALLPEFDSAAASSTTPFAKVDGTEAEELATRLDIKGYPTLLFIHRGDGPPIEFDGRRDASTISRWVASKAAPSLTELKSSSEVLAFAKGKPIALVLFTPSGLSSAEAEALRGVAAASTLPCAVATSDPADGALGLGALTTALTPPVLVALTQHDAKHYALGPPLSHKAMLHFGRSHALPSVVAYATGAMEEAIFGTEVPAHLLLFHTGPVDDALASSLAELGNPLRGRALVATVDVGAHAEVASYFDVGPSGSLPTPTLMGFALANGTKFAHAGSLSASAMRAFAETVLRGEATAHLRSQPEPAPSGPLVELVGSSFARVAFDPHKDVLVQFYSPKCGHCAKLKPVYAKVAAK